MPLNLAVVGLLARLLSPEDMGAYFLALSLVTAMSSLGNLGMGATMVRLVASSLAINDPLTANRAIRQSFSWATIGALIAAGVMMLFGSNLGVPANMVNLVALWGVVQIGQKMLSEGLRSFNDIRSATIFQNRSLSNAVIALVLLIVWVSGTTIDLRIVFSIVVIVGVSATIVGTILLWHRIHKEVTIPANPCEPAPLRIFRQALPVLGIDSMHMIRAQVGIWLVAAFLSNEEIALYGSANRLVYLVSVPLLTIVNALIPPIIAELYAQKQIAKLERTVRSLATFAGVVAFAVTIVFVIGGKFILGTIFGSFYTDAWLVLGILAVSQFIGVAGGSCGVTLIMTGHQKSLMKITIISALLAVSTTFLGARLYGMVGIACAMVLTVFAQNILMVQKVKKLVGIWTHLRLVWK